MAVVITRNPVAPVCEPVTLDEAKRYLRVLYDNEDRTVELLITQAREMLEQAVGKSLVETEVHLINDRLFRSFRLPYPPVASITEATLDGEDVSGDFNEIGLLMRGGRDLEVKYISGPYQASGLKLAILEVLAHLWVTRGGEATLPGTVKQWIQQNGEGWFI